jgi:hypothetical protein
MLSCRASLPPSRQTLNFAAGIIRRHGILNVKREETSQPFVSCWISAVMAAVKERPNDLQ